MREAHAYFVDDSGFHARIGSWLSRNRSELRLEAGERTARGMTWHRRAAPASSQPSAGSRGGVGPQVPSDDPWIARMRLHQSWWRDEVLGLPYGTGPSPNSTRELGSMLDDEGDRPGANFVNAAALAAYEKRAGLGVEPYRARRNLLSSQPMCINIFGPMALDLDLATRALRAWLPGEVARVTDVRIEWAPEPRDEFLDDRTSFDAFVEYEDVDGQLAFLGVETKLTEPFTSTGGYHRRPAYRALTTAPGSPWIPDSLSRLGDVTWCQLWRNHLLVQALRTIGRNEYDGRGRLLVLHHELDPGCANAISGYRQLLTEQGKQDVLELTIGTSVGLLRDVARTEDEQRWAQTFHRRYVNLRESAHLVS